MNDAILNFVYQVSGTLRSELLFSSPRNHQFEQLETKHKTFLLKLNKVVVINRAAAVCGDKLILAFIVEFVAHMKIIF